MKIIAKKPFWLFCTLTFILIFYISACGYNIYSRSHLPFSEISIGLIENRTIEPKLQDKLHKALIEEFIKHGVRINTAARLKLTGIIHHFDMSSLSEKNGITAEYRIFINADFKLQDDTGKTTEIKNIASPFIDSFTGSENLGKLIASKEMAEEMALSNISMQLIGTLIYK